MIDLCLNLEVHTFIQFYLMWHITSVQTEVKRTKTSIVKQLLNASTVTTPCWNLG